MIHYVPDFVDHVLVLQWILKKMRPIVETIWGTIHNEFHLGSLKVSEEHEHEVIVSI